MCRFSQVITLSIGMFFILFFSTRCGAQYAAESTVVEVLDLVEFHRERINTATSFEDVETSYEALRLIAARQIRAERRDATDEILRFFKQRGLSGRDHLALEHLARLDFGAFLAVAEKLTEESEFFVSEAFALRRSVLVALNLGAFAVEPANDFGNEEYRNALDLIADVAKGEPTDLKGLAADSHSILFKRDTKELAAHIKEIREFVPPPAAADVRSQPVYKYSFSRTGPGTASELLTITADARFGEMTVGRRFATRNLLPNNGKRQHRDDSGDRAPPKRAAGAQGATGAISIGTPLE